jgi:[DsrC]-trisulfide reductase subunit J
MKLYNGKMIIAGLVVFVALVGMPIWYNIASGTGSGPPDLVLPDKTLHTKCVEDTAYMRTSHMDLLNQWRNSVVREGERVYTAKDGTKYNMSLSNTCLECHNDKDKFCKRCHDYMAVKPFCWDCHTALQGE